ncbi:undecaprenyl/decaprenyl-phosphate alpha-N-acetylglucosaminyl 1-phosphate transferase [Candidatus Uhrbacteria bacterium]|nr:undecaprenyl/decaprenyl-phosphate alpha-N-acetylglucosaminyl 1-phosphate transferase [Candidatus Uhrbacteria bacterium]
MSRSITFVTMLIAFLLAGIFSLILAPLTRRLARYFGAMDVPGGRKQHAKTTPLFGGVGIGLVIIFLLYVAWNMGWLQGNIRFEQLISIICAIGILGIGGIIDDVRPLPARIQILFPALAAICVIAGGTGFVQITNIFGKGGLNVVWFQWSAISFPADILTFVWLLIATYALKIQDGIDGLVTGLAVIGSGLVASISSSIAYYQPAIAITSSIVGGAFIGFLPSNFSPSKQFLGESGSVMAGFLLGVLAILSSAKVAIALCVLMIPIADIMIVIGSRMRRGVPWHQGDRSHLHFRLLAAGISPHLVVLLLWGLSATAGILALSFQTRGKIFIISSLFAFTVFASWISSSLAKKRGKSI